MCVHDLEFKLGCVIPHKVNRTGSGQLHGNCVHHYSSRATKDWKGRMQTVLWIIGVLFVIGGIFSLFRRQWIWGAISIVIGMALGGFGFFA